MQIHHTILGELYGAMSPLELKQLSAYLNEKPNDKVRQLHGYMVKLTKENRLATTEMHELMAKLQGTDKRVYSSFTTWTNLLTNHIKEFMLLSKIREKNIYTETLWGEVLIERRLTRNLLLKLTNFKFNFFHDNYSVMKLFYHKREQFFYQFINLTRKNYKVLIHSQIEQIKSFEDYFNFYILELYSSLVSYLKQNNEIHLVNKDDIYRLTTKNMDSEIDLIKIQSHTLLILYETNIDSYYSLRNILFEKYNEFANATHVQLVPTLLNFGYYQIFKGNESFEEENYRLLVFLEKNRILFNHGVYSVIRLFTYIRLELYFGTIEKAEELLQESLGIIAPAQKDSFQYLIESRINFAKQDYKLSLRKILTINPSDSVFYYPQYKIMLIKNYIMLSDIDRLMAERENFYKYINHHKNIQEDEKRRYKLFIKYSEYLTQARYDYLTDYMKRRIEQALLPTSPYFTEKPWVRERWEYLSKTTEEE